LTIIPHPKPYKLHWLNESGDLTVQHQLKVKLSIGKYEDSVLCDVVPMEACHVLLGRPWQFDKKTMHNGLTNEITFTHMDRKFVLHPLSPSQVVEDQIQMRKKLEKERKEDKKKSPPNLPKKVTKDESEVGEIGVPSPEVIQHENILTIKSLNQVLNDEQPSCLLLCKGTLICIATFLELKSLPPKIENLLKEFEDIFPKEGPIGLPPFRGIKHQIDLVPGASLPNRPAYRTNPQETKEIKSQVQELLEKGWVQKSLSPCAVPILSVPKKD